MSNIYLDILGLKTGASQNDIKSAYRKLSKKYHPDVNKDANAKNKFIEINEAYKFLTGVGPRPNNQKRNYDYNPQDKAYAEWLRKARAYAAEKARDVERRQTETIKHMLRIFNFIGAAVFIFNILLAVDFCLPTNAHDQQITGRGKYFDSSVIYADLYLTDFNMRFDENVRFDTLTWVNKATVHASPIFKKPRTLDLELQNGTFTYNQIYSIYDFFVWIIPILLIASTCYYFVVEMLDPKLTLAIFMTMGSIAEIYIFSLF